jgi:PmbA protein
MARDSARTPDMMDVAQACIRIAKAKGAGEVGVRTYKVRDVTVDWRDGRVEKIGEATTRGVGVQLYVEGRYSSVQSSDLRPEALESFLADSIAMTRSLTPDPHRTLPDPALYAGQAAVDLKLEDPAYPTVTAERRRSLAQEMEQAARSVQGASAILSVTTGFNDTRSEQLRVHSNGFQGTRVDTAFWTYASVSVKDGDGRRPEDWSASGVRFLGELPEVAQVGRRAAERAIGCLGSKKPDTAVLPMVLENRAGGRLLQALGAALNGGALQQKRSFLEGKLGQAVGSRHLHVLDDPLIAKGFGSRLFDSEGIAARPRAVFEDGVLRSYYIDTYYGKKLAMAPTTGAPSNVTWRLGDKSQKDLVADIKDGILVTGFLGGNSNSTTGDFSFGVQGFRIRGGSLAEPVAELNIAGSHLDFWKRLVAVGNDPYPYSTMRTPTLVFEGVQFAGA